jgi:hypothetical protein
MKLSNSLRFVLVALALAGLLSAGLAQTPPPTPTDTVPTITNGLAHENVGSQNLASRSPGRMVSAGVASAQAAVKFGRTNAATITETETEVDFVDGFFSQAIDILLERFDNLLVYFANLFLTRAGLPSFDPGDISNDNNNTNTNTNTNDNANDNDNLNDNGNDNDNSNLNDNDNLNANQNDNTGRPGGVRKQQR